MAVFSELRFLVVDDMLTMRNIVMKNLQNLGATQISLANNGIAAWDMLEKTAALRKPIDFVISDWNMPEMSGIDLLLRCRNSSDYKNVAFLLVTAESEVVQVREAISAGVDNYVVKPFTPAAFQAKVNAILAKRFPTAKAGK